MPAMLSAATAQTVRPADLEVMAATKPVLVTAYDSNPLQIGELRLPATGTGPFPVVVVIHGGCFTKGYASLHGTAPLATAITTLGYATWNIEYRQAGDPGGGWPGTFQDWSAATNYLRVLAKSQPIRLDHIVVVGHSAGATAALWLAARPTLPKTSAIADRDPLPIAQVIAIDGPVDLKAMAAHDEEICRKPVVVPFIGGTPADQPRRYDEASPVTRLPISARQSLIASVVLTPDEAEAYRAAAAAKGQAVDVLTVQNGGHFDIIAPGTPVWNEQVEPFLAKTLAQ